MVKAASDARRTAMRTQKDDADEDGKTEDTRRVTADRQDQ